MDVEPKIRSIFIFNNYMGLRDLCHTIREESFSIQNRCKLQLREIAECALKPLLQDSHPWSELLVHFHAP